MKAIVVTLDRVICCYEDMPALVHEAASRAGRALAIVQIDNWTAFGRDGLRARYGRARNVRASVPGSATRPGRPGRRTRVLAVSSNQRIADGAVQPGKSVRVK